MYYFCNALLPTLPNLQLGSAFDFTAETLFLPLYLTILPDLYYVRLFIFSQAESTLGLSFCFYLTKVSQH